ncbi:MAG: tRNA lysidine(34) synthetase TilS [Alphaproteobacteria bacterium]|nr:MAG: tRNA lysidine(34) synthetase TilS [Alphaproteobacteria bacterium]
MTIITRNAELFALCMQKLGLDTPGTKIAVAVSGGGDSLALTLLMQQWVEKRGGRMLALTVDHGLRPDSAAEAAGLHALLEKRGIRHDVLKWVGEKPHTHIQERAREARYALLLAACRREGFPTLALAHNLEDQVETFWMRLSKGSGLDGLAAMAPSRVVDGVNIVRPVLSFSRADLREVCRDFGVEWAEDPSNRNEQFLRVKLRQVEDLLAAEGMTPQRLSQTLQKLEEARDALQVWADEAAGKMIAFHPEGFATLNTPAWRLLPADIQRRVLSSALMAVAPRDYAPGFEQLEQLRCDMPGEKFSGRTLSGCEIFPGKEGEMTLCREAAAAAGASPLENGLLWDGRFRVSDYRNGAGLQIRILGEEGLARFRQKGAPETPPFTRLESLPYKVRKVIPALWKGEILMAIPHLNWTAAEADSGLLAGKVEFVRNGAAPVKIV